MTCSVDLDRFTSHRHTHDGRLINLGWRGTRCRRGDWRGNRFAVGLGLLLAALKGKLASRKGASERELATQMRKLTARQRFLSIRTGGEPLLLLLLLQGRGALVFGSLFEGSGACADKCTALGSRWHRLFARGECTFESSTHSLLLPALGLLENLPKSKSQRHTRSNSQEKCKVALRFLAGAKGENKGFQKGASKFATVPLCTTKCALQVQRVPSAWENLAETLLEAVLTLEPPSESPLPLLRR